MSGIRNAAVAGRFYPADPRRLQATITAFLTEAIPSGDGSAPKALIVPHAGYVYSGPIAGTGYARLRQSADGVRRVVLLGPAHTLPLRGLAASSASSFATPLGDVPVDTATVQRLLTLPQVRLMDAAHETEHGLEVHLPFLQMVCHDFSIVPLVAGEATSDEVAEVLSLVWGGPETLIVVSSDLSHYHDYATARSLDEATARAIERLDGEALSRDSACGRVAIRGLLQLARIHGLHAQTLDLRSSGDTAGPRDRVVGYGAFVLA